ncbi:MAG: hypothetical protein QOE90_596 [Thermoplasmata archaeon]|nr:hypothetical protein [Thermoplasmata archaeon]
MSAVEPRRLALALLVAAPVLALAGFGLVSLARLATDPCTQWGASATVPATCRTLSGVDESKARYVAIVGGLDALLAAGGLAVFAGVAWARPGLALAGAALLLAVGLVGAPGGVGLALAWSSAALAVAASRMVDGFRGAVRAGAFALGGVAAAGALFILVATVQRGGAALAYSFIALAPLLILAGAAFWPQP